MTLKNFTVKKLGRVILVKSTFLNGFIKLQLKVLKLKRRKGLTRKVGR